MDSVIDDYNDASWHQIQSEQNEVLDGISEYQGKVEQRSPTRADPEGLHYAICTTMIDLGMQKARSAGNNDSQQVHIGFELPLVRVKFQKDGVETTGPAIISRQFGLSIGKKSNLRPFLKGWRNGKDFTPEDEKGFEITSIVGKLVQLFIQHEASADGTKVYSNIKSAIGLTDEQKSKVHLGELPRVPEGSLLVYSPDDHDEETYQKIPEWIRKKIDDRVKVAAPAGGGTEDFNDDIPF